MNLLRFGVPASALLISLVLTHSQAREDSTSCAPPPAAGRADLAMMWSHGTAKGRGPVRLTHAPMRIADIDFVTPMGLMVGGHVTPSDHLGIAPKDRNAPPDRYDVLAPAAGFIVSIQRRTVSIGDPTDRRTERNDHRVILEHSGTFWTFFDNLNALDKAILTQTGEIPPAGPPTLVRVPVKAGQVIGKIGGGHGIDFGVVNSEMTLKGFVVPEHYDAEPWKIHCADPFDYFDEPVRSQLLTLNLRKTKPYGGKIDYDVDGRLVGNWFHENTDGLLGTREGGRRGVNWKGHLAIVYHHLDPTKITISLGDFGGNVRQFWVRGNAPDPARVSAANGAVKYELIWPAIGSAGQPFGMSDAAVQGVLLVQLTTPRKLRVETFVGKTAAQVSGFTSAALVYER